MAPHLATKLSGLWERSHCFPWIPKVRPQSAPFRSLLDLKARRARATGAHVRQRPCLAQALARLGSPEQEEQIPKGPHVRLALGAAEWQMLGGQRRQRVSGGTLWCLTGGRYRYRLFFRDHGAPQSGTPLEGVPNSLDVVTRPNGAPSYWASPKGNSGTCLAGN